MDRGIEAQIRDGFGIQSPARIGAFVREIALGGDRLPEFFGAVYAGEMTGAANDGYRFVHFWASGMRRTSTDLRQMAV